VGTVLKQEHFEDLKIPLSITQRIAPDMMAVYVTLPKEQAAGGIIQKDEHVDVFLTTTVCYDRDCQLREEMTAPIALNLKIVAKRDDLWTRLAPIDQN